MNKFYLITGANGFIGKHIVKKLSLCGFQLKTIVREGSDTSFLKKNNIKIIETKNLFQESREWWEDILVDVDILFHLAWYVNPKDYLDSYQNIECLIGTIKIAKIASERNVKKFIGLGTCFEYEESLKDLTVDSPLNPKTLYAATKVSTYYILLNLLKFSNTKFLWCRLFYLYGDGEKSGRLVPYIINNLKKNKYVELKTPNNIIDYLDVEKAAEQIIRASLSDQEGSINICSGIGISVREFALSLALNYKKTHLIKEFINTIEQKRIVGKPNF